MTLPGPKPNANHTERKTTSFQMTPVCHALVRLLAECTGQPLWQTLETAVLHEAQHVLTGRPT